MEDFAGMSMSRSHSKTVSDEYEISTFHVGAPVVRVLVRLLALHTWLIMWHSEHVRSGLTEVRMVGLRANVSVDVK
jgi:hypothetical protein